MKINQNKDFINNEIQLNFDIFKLNISKEDVSPLYWICFKGKNLHKIIFRIFTEVQNSLKISKRKLILNISNLMNCGNTCVSDRIYNVKEKFPIIMIEKLLELWKTHLNKNNKQINNKKLEIIENTEYLIQNHPLSKPVLAVKKLTLPLCKLAGAHAADGSLVKRYPSVHILKLSQKNKQYALVYAKLIRDVFNFEPNMHIEKKCYTVRVSNKIIARYLGLFLDFPYGYKSKIVTIPKIIKNSSMCYQRAFACGIMSYEGSVEMTEVISYGGLSKILRDELIDIFVKSNLKVVKRNYKNKVFLFRTLKLNKEEARKWLSFFVENTEKWWKIKDIIDGYSHAVNDIQTAKKILDSIYSPRSISLTKLIDLIKGKHNGIVYSKDLQKEIKVSDRNTRLMINILNKANILIPKRQGIYINQEIRDEFFNKISLRPVEIAKILKADRKKVQNWKDGWCSIPQSHFKGLLSLAKMDIKNIKNSIRQTYDGRFGYYYNPDVKSWKLPYRPWFREVYT